MKVVIGYIRVSTHDQKASGFGFSTQEQEILAYVKASGGSMLQLHREVASAKGGDSVTRRPVLRDALAEARALGAALLVPRIDRLSRDPDELKQIKANSGVEIIAVVEGRLTDRNLSVHAARIAEETRLLSERTKAGIARARASGKKLGNTKNLDEARRISADVNARKARDRLLVLEPIIRGLDEAARSPQMIADELNRQGIPTASGKPWTAANARRVRDKLRRQGTANAAAITAPIDNQIDRPLTLDKLFAHDPEWGAW